MSNFLPESDKLMRLMEQKYDQGHQIQQIKKIY